MRDETLNVGDRVRHVADGRVVGTITDIGRGGSFYRVRWDDGYSFSYAAAQLERDETGHRVPGTPRVV
jgi:hypothetical protein